MLCRPVGQRRDGFEGSLVARLWAPQGPHRDGFFAGKNGGSLVYRASSCDTRQTPGPNGATHVSLGWSAAQPQVASPHVRSAPTGQHNTATIVPPRWGGCRVMAFVLGFRGCAATPQADLCGPCEDQSLATSDPSKNPSRRCRHGRDGNGVQVPCTRLGFSRRAVYQMMAPIDNVLDEGGHRRAALVAEGRPTVGRKSANACVSAGLVSPPVAFTSKLRGYEQKRHIRPGRPGHSLRNAAD